MLKKSTLRRLNGQQMDPSVAAHSNLNWSVTSGTIYTTCTVWLMAFGNPGKRLRKGRELPKQNQHVWMRRLKSQSQRKLNSDTINPHISTCRQLILVNGPQQSRCSSQSQRRPISHSGNIHALPPTPAVMHQAAWPARTAQLIFQPPLLLRVLSI